MESYRLTNKLDCCGSSNKYYAVKYDYGEVKSEKYGEAKLSGHILFLTRHGELRPNNERVEQLKEKANVWLNEMGLEVHYEDAFEKIYLQYACVYTAPTTDLDDQEFYFITMLFTFIFDDAICKQKRLNRNNSVKTRQDLIRVAECLISIIDSCGDDISMAAAINKLNTVFRTTCIVLSHVCRYSFKHMREDDQKRFARELADFIRANKWIHEFRTSPYKADEYLFLRSYDIGFKVISTPIYFSLDIHLSNEIRMHPLFMKYMSNVGMQITLVNDIMSLPKELAGNEGENFVFIKYEKYDLQKSIRETEKTLNELTIDLKKMGMKLISYFSSDQNMANYIKATEIIMDGFVYWHLNAKRYGNYRYEEYEVEYDLDYDSWFEKICETNVKNVNEPVLSEFSTM